ncbi:hypothetical protein QM806_27610 [Rhodococcus sp. IEGM 1351]|uniref:hypothetical protein n=1 Tax=Rhodococcus sp. IEGM 1351 TaxID=3047089 RepID=UPI0024B857BE|nr:hypothetical protein [Rhodococcus sp. IEGM 1351]MDI9939158.1 hypothetical protein [Rhodococcus sp. IEGM 1351]
MTAYDILLTGNFRADMVSSDTAAQAVIVAATRELHLPTIRTEAVRHAEIAAREQQSHVAFSPKSWPPRPTTPNAAGPAASTTRSSRASNGSPTSTSISCPGAALGHLAAGGYLDAGEPVVLLGDSGTGTGTGTGGHHYADHTECNLLHQSMSQRSSDSSSAAV